MTPDEVRAVCGAGSDLPTVTTTSAALPLAPPTGWRCPGCARCLAPTERECPHCQPAAPATDYLCGCGSRDPNHPMGAMCYWTPLTLTVPPGVPPIDLRGLPP